MAGKSGDLGSTPIPVTHPRSDASWSLPSLGLCFPICTMGTWQCLGPLYLLVPSQGDRSVNTHVTEHSQVAHVGDQPVTSRHCRISQGHRLPSHLALLGIERSVRGACALKSRGPMKAGAAVRFSKALRISQGDL